MGSFVSFAELGSGQPKLVMSPFPFSSFVLKVSLLLGDLFIFLSNILRLNLCIVIPYYLSLEFIFKSSISNFLFTHHFSFCLLQGFSPKCKLLIKAEY